jgi:hypothetical protein
MSAGYAWEKLHTAVLILAQGSRPLRERLEDAYISSLIRLHPEEDFPDLDARDRFNTLMDEIAPNGRLDIALANWPDEDLSRIVEGLVGLYDTIARRLGD